jgi:hypothetical protein
MRFFLCLSREVRQLGLAAKFSRTLPRGAAERDDNAPTADTAVIVVDGDLVATQKERKSTRLFPANCYVLTLTLAEAAAQIFFRLRPMSCLGGLDHYPVD